MLKRDGKFVPKELGTGITRTACEHRSWCDGMLDLKIEDEAVVDALYGLLQRNVFPLSVGNVALLHEFGDGESAGNLVFPCGATPRELLQASTNRFR